MARLDRLRSGLQGAAEHLRRDPAAEGTVRRIARTLSGLEGVEVALRWSAEAVASARDESLLPGAEALLVTLDAAAARERGEDDGFPGPRVLVVEGDAGAAAGFTRALAGGSARIRWLPLGGALRECLAECPADLLVLDLLLPDRDGVTLLQGLRENPATSAIPVVVLGPDRGPMDRAGATAPGAAVFMEKPVEPEALLREVRRLLQGSGPQGVVEGDVNGAATREAPARNRDGLDMEIPDPPEVSGEDLDREFREMEREGSAAALLTLGGFGTLVERVGDEAARTALTEVVEALQARMPGARVGLRGAPEVGVLFPGVHRDGAFQELKAVLEALVQDPCPAPGADVLAEAATGGVVSLSMGESLDEVMARAEAVRTGVETEGRRIVAAADAGGEAVPVILLVEDDPVSARLVEYKLHQVGFEVVHFTNGDDALEALTELAFDLAIFDLNLPGTDGFQLVEAVRSVAHGTHRPVIILSGLSGEAGIVRALEMGADDYVMKPFSPVELTARVRRLLATARDAR